MTRSDTDANVGSYLQYGMFCLLRSSPDRIKKKEKNCHEAAPRRRDRPVRHRTHRLHRRHQHPERRPRGPLPNVGRRCHRGM